MRTAPTAWHRATGAGPSTTASSRACSVTGPSAELPYAPTWRPRRPEDVAGPAVGGQEPGRAAARTQSAATAATGWRRSIAASCRGGSMMSQPAGQDAGDGHRRDRDGRAASDRVRLPGAVRRSSDPAAGPSRRPAEPPTDRRSRSRAPAPRPATAPRSTGTAPHPSAANVQAAAVSSRNGSRDRAGTQTATSRSAARSTRNGSSSTAPKSGEPHSTIAGEKALATSRSNG